MTSPDLRTRLTAAIGDAYVIERELGGGGMSRVFLAEETRLGRKVVIKVLPPEMGAGVNIERFEREIQLAAKLQHPHIVPLLTAGSEGDLLYYMMPFIEGESLRAKLAREGELPVAEALRILKDVIDALHYAHSHQVVHRDIKPDNVLLSGNHAVVTDFGVAKAVSASTGESSLTSLGVALGTPAYMSPEQASAEPNVDHRADIYAVGAMAYEMLTGRPPFTGTNAQQVLAAHITNNPDPVSTHRTTVPSSLDNVVLRCLQKKPADRFQRADEIVPHLDALLTPSGGMTPTGTQPLQSVDYAARARLGHPMRVAGLYTAASGAVLALVYGVVLLAGLPSWVVGGAAVLLLAGLPIMLVTGAHERKRALAAGTGVHVTTPTDLRRHLTWRKALIGGGLAFGALMLLTTGFMVSRLMGIGPGATLVSSGVLGERERLVLSQFENATSDSAVAETVTELLRIDMSQSPTVSILEETRIESLLERMGQTPDAELTPDLAREVAQREGLKAYIAGEVRSVGSDLVISARVVSAGSNEDLTSTRVTADGEQELIDAVDRLSADLRAKVGESLRSVRADAPLDRLTTTSLEALRLYTQAERVADDGDYRRAIALLEEAVARDSMFAMALRRLGMYMTNPDFLGQMGVRGDSALRRAYALRDRVSDRERYLIEASYASRAENDWDQAATSYLALLEKYPDDATALNNLGVAYTLLGRFAERDEIYRRAIEAGVAGGVTYNNLAGSLLNRGELDEASDVVDRFAERFPTSDDVYQRRAEIAEARGDWDEAEQIVETVLQEHPSEEVWARGRLAALAELRGQLERAARQSGLARRAQARQQDMRAEERDFQIAMDQLDREIWFNPDRNGLTRRLDALRRQNDALAADLPAQLRGFRLAPFVYLNALLDRGDQAESTLQEVIGLIPENLLESAGGRTFVRSAQAAIASARSEPREAVDILHEVRAEDPECQSCYLFEIAREFDRAGQPDSAMKYFDAWLDTSGSNRSARELPVALRRMGELHEAEGNQQQAIDYYNRFVELWSEADPDLQPIVAEYRERISRLLRDR